MTPLLKYTTVVNIYRLVLCCKTEFMHFVWQEQSVRYCFNLKNITDTKNIDSRVVNFPDKEKSSDLFSSLFYHDYGGGEGRHVLECEHYFPTSVAHEASSLPWRNLIGVTSREISVLIPPNVFLHYFHNSSLCSYIYQDCWESLCKDCLWCASCSLLCSECGVAESKACLC